MAAGGGGRGWRQGVAAGVSSFSFVACLIFLIVFVGSDETTLIDRELRRSYYFFRSERRRTLKKQKDVLVHSAVLQRTTKRRQIEIQLPAKDEKVVVLDFGN